MVTPQSFLLFCSTISTALGLALRAVDAGSPNARMDHLVVALHSSVTGSSRLAVQQHREERIRRGSVSRHHERHLAPVSELRFTLGSAYHWPDYRIRGRNRHTSMGATNVSSIQKCLTGLAALHQLPASNGQRDNVVD
jgi:hypothetical protein